MKRKIETKIRRIVSLSLVLAMILSGTNVYAASNDVNFVNSEDDLTMLSYNIETGETTYKVYRDEDLSDVSSYAIKCDEYATSPLYDGIIGVDNRVQITNTTSSPYRNVCCLIIKFPNGSTCIGSGFLVHPNVMLTAGHCVYNHERGGWATDIEIRPARNGENSAPLGIAHPVESFVTKEWVDTSSYDYDWAIVDLDTSFETYMNYGYYDNYYNQLGTSVTAIGYPDQFRYYMYEDSNSIMYVTEYQYTVLCDMTGGQSGGPLIDAKTGYVVGINSNIQEVIPGQEYSNRCVRITPRICSYLNEHFNQS